MSARSKLILQLARKCEETVISHSHSPDNDHEEMPNTDHPSYKILMPSPTVNSDFSNILDFDENFLVIGDTINKSLAVSLTEDQIQDIGSVTSSPAPSLTADLTAILNSDDSYADKDYLPGQSESESSDDTHQRFHKGEKGYVCELCPDKSYTQIGGLILHRRKVHLQTPTCTCNYCGKQFYEKHYLETHIRQWHTGERPFSCEICGKAFSCNGTLLRHRKDSHGEKQPCPKCGKMYTDGKLRKHLKRHKIREEGIKRKKYTCEYCGTEMNFTSRKRHLLKQHGIMLKGRGEQAERIPVADAI